MIDLDHYQDRDEPAQILATIGGVLTRQTGLPSSIRLVPSLDGPTRERLLSLGEEVFGPGGEVFDRRALAELEEDPDGLLVVLDVEGSIEGLCFGYYEDEATQMVDGTEFFIDSALVSPRWQTRGIGWLAGAAVLLLVTELGDVHHIGMAIWSGGDVPGLQALYRRMGFVEASCPHLEYPCMAVTLEPGRVNSWRKVLGLPPRELAGRDSPSLARRDG